MNFRNFVSDETFLPFRGLEGRSYERHDKRYNRKRIHGMVNRD